MANIFKIEQGILALTLVDTAAVGYSPDWETPGGLGVDAITLGAYVGAGLDGGDFSCQITSGAINASPNTTDETVPGTFCEPEETITNVGKTSFVLDVTGLQDPNLVAGISRYLYEHDTKEAYFLLGMAGPGHTPGTPLPGTTVPDPPKAAGRVRIIAGAIGGDARTTLTFTVSLPVTGKPDIEFGNPTESEVVATMAAAEPAAQSFQDSYA